jgi:hypothetical protein
MLLNLKRSDAVPFERQWRVRVDVQAKDAVDYVPGWPRIGVFRGRVLFKGKTMVTSSQARIYRVACRR